MKRLDRYPVRWSRHRNPQGELGTPDVRAHLRRAWDLLDVGDPEELSPDEASKGWGFLGGQLLRPRFAASAAGLTRIVALEERFWLAVLAVQLAHEASLVHDDVIDEARLRRGRPTLCGRRGVGAALVVGDQLLARAYLAAARTGSPTFTLRFAHAVDRTISGERAQGESAGTRLDRDRAREIARMKSGELFGCALASAAVLEGDARAELLAELGRDVGMLYQEVDDLLDFCPSAWTGKPPFADQVRRLWTWPRAFIDESDPPGALFRPGHGGVPALAALQDLERSGAELLARLHRELPHAEELRAGIRGWLGTARTAVRREIAEVSTERVPGAHRLIRPFAGRHHGAPRTRARSGAGPEEDAARILSRHGRSFHFASRLMPPAARGPVTRVYGFCRRVDDAVDGASTPEQGRRRLEELFDAALDAYHHGEAGDAIIGRTMSELRRAELDFGLVEKLFEGVAMDLEPRRYADLVELRLYTHRVAGVVGLWIAGLAGIRDRWALDLAEEMGHAMQLTNISRDVGADLELGRVYLPGDLLARHELSEDALRALREGDGPIPAGYAALLEELMGRADVGYGAAFQALPYLPAEYRRAMAVAARVYQGIHGEIRRNGYDTLRRRARTGPVRKGVLAASALRGLSAAEKRAVPEPSRTHEHGGSTPSALR